MSAPHQGSIKRQFQKGLWFRIANSPKKREFHVKINRIQIDNQMIDCLFPVILAPVPPPKTVLAEAIPKPFMEVSILQYRDTERSETAQYKYVCALIQEAHLKIERDFLDAIMDFFVAEKEILDEDMSEILNEDLELARKELKELAKLRINRGIKDFYDYLHLGPLKVHVSLTLSSSGSGSVQARTKRRSNVLFTLLGLMTDLDDNIFRLSYFERKHNFYSREDLYNEIYMHYFSQGVKQLYVVLFGAEFLGNPFGLVVGATRGVEDLFYEPFVGAVEGPGEFAEGLVIGVRSVFSGVVGGAAGSVSKIFSGVGKGLAALTFDSDFQKQRRKQLKKRADQNFGEGMARNTRGLAMGIFEGVTGVATKPIQGARQEGVGGFFKGVGKGVVGLVARPTGGVIDFASGTFDSVKRVTENQEEIRRTRDPRFLHSDGIVRNYNVKEAEGWKFLRELDKGKYAKTDSYVTHENVAADAPSVLMISNKRILFMSYQSVLGNWTTAWEFAYIDIIVPPTTGRDDDRWFLVIEPKDQKQTYFLGVFNTSNAGKKVFLQNRESVKRLAREIAQQQRTSVE